MSELTMKASTIVRVLEMTMQDVRAQEISERLGVKHVREVQNAHGFPNERTMLDQVQQLLRLRDQDVTFDADLSPAEPKTAAAPRPPAVPAPRRVEGGPVPNGATHTTDLRAFLEHATKHPRGAIKFEAERILARIDKLREAIAEVDADTKRLAEIRELEERLAALKGAKPRTARRETGSFKCDECAAPPFDTRQGLRMHHTRKHAAGVSS